MVYLLVLVLLDVYGDDEYEDGLDLGWDVGEDLGDGGLYGGFWWWVGMGVIVFSFGVIGDIVVMNGGGVV